MLCLLIHIIAQVRHIELPGAEPYTSYESLPRRFIAHGFKLAKALTFAVLLNMATKADIKAYGEGLATLRERSLAIPTGSAGSSVNAVDELLRAWQQWDAIQSEEDERMQKSEACLRNLSRLPIFMKPL